MRLPEEYTKARRVSTKGGCNVFINSDVLNKALKFGELAEDTKHLKVKSYATRDRRGRAKIIIKLIPE